MIMRLMTQTPQELQANLNDFKTMFCEMLAADGIIQDAEVVNNDYLVVVVERGWFGKAMDKLWGLKGDATTIRLIKVVNR